MPHYNRFDSNHLIENRQIRVFLSSTFSDMEEERSALIKTFERIKIEASRRNVYLSVIDLRWGVTEEEAQSGKVLSVCLNEIEHSHPFFIGLLGNRYGYSPDISEIEKNPELKERYPWIEKDIAEGLSITEMEMQYGVLRNTADIDAAFFIKHSDLPDDNPKLTALKTKIRNQQQYLVKNYSTIEELCKHVENELASIIDRHFPDIDHSPLERERIAQRAYINSRHANYLKRQDYFDIIDGFVHSTERHLVFTGDSGIGKSALLANWMKENEDNGDFNLICHFVGNSFTDNNYENILRHLCDEIRDLYHLKKKGEDNETIEDKAKHLINGVAIQEKPLVIIIDGIDQIVSPGNEKLLLWLPAANDKVKYLFSTLSSDETMRVFKQRGYRVENVTPLTRKERERFVVDYIGGFGKHLNESQLQHVVDDPENENTLVLKSLLEELICFGSYERLDSRINYYLSAVSIQDFFDRVLNRMEEDYSAGCDLVRHALTLIAVSEHGLSEDELLAMLGCRQLDWHLFFCAFYGHFIVKNGLITFSHQYMASAVEVRYHTTDDSQTASFRQEIISYFNKVDNDDKTLSDRSVSELAHQYYNLADWDNLYNTLLNFNSFDSFYCRNQSLLALYWRTLIDVNKKFSIGAYLDLGTSVEDANLALKYYDIGFFIQDYIADYKMALKYYFKAVKLQKQVLDNDHPDIAASYNNIGYIYECISNYDEALKYYGMSLSIREKVLGDNSNTATTYNNIASVYDSLGKFKEALTYYNRALEIFRMIVEENDPDMATVYNNIALHYCYLCNFQKAREYFDKALKIDEEVLGIKHPDTASSYDNICSVFDFRGKYRRSLEFHIKALGIRKELFGEEHPDVASSYNCLGGVYSDMDNFDKALEYYMKSLRIRKDMLGRNHPETATCYNNIGAVYDSLGEYNIAIACYFESLEIYLEKYGPRHPDTAMCFNNLGTAYYSLGDYKKALKFYDKALKIRKKVYGIKHLDTASSYDNIGVVYLVLEEYDQALENCRSALSIFEDLAGDKHLETAICYNNIGAVYSKQGNFDKAMEYYSKSLTIRSKLLGEDHPDTLLVKENIYNLMVKMDSRQ